MQADPNSGLPVSALRTGGPAQKKGAGAKQAPKPGRNIFFRSSVQDPDVNITPSGFELIGHPGPQQDGISSMSMDDMCKAFAQKSAGAIAAGPATEPEPAAQVAEDKQSFAEVLQQVEALERIVREKTAEASRARAESDRLRQEAERLRDEEQSKRRLAQNFPVRAVAARQTTEQQLAEAKVETAELGTELAALKRDMMMEEENKHSKQEEARTVARTAKAKKAEQSELERLVARLEEVRREAASSEERAQQLAAEVRAATEALNTRTEAYKRAVSDFFEAKKRLDGLAVEYARTSGEESMMEALIKRYTAEADEAQRRYQQTITRSRELAHQFDAAMEAARQAKQEEARVLEEVARLGAENPIKDLAAPKVTQAPTSSGEIRESRGY
ncbi:hypothetical protein WJX81_007937 [Elliptochloris bilobata]|uniref:Uncharacterized protein n=1 Tax=Elliptochloris bilobata TaxID=381761 RepID=A0AAW1S7V4_9CHLO